MGLASMTGQYPTQHSRGASLSCSFMLKLVQAGTTCVIYVRLMAKGCLQMVVYKVSSRSLWLVHTGCPAGLSALES